jgi:hypothetical protein
LRSLPSGATDAEEVQADAAIHEALGRLDYCADLRKLRTAAQEAIQPIFQAVKRRRLEETILHWAICQLSFWKRTEQDEAHLRRRCAEILASLPADVTEPEAKESIASTIADITGQVERRQAEEERQRKKPVLLQQGMSEITNYIYELKARNRISEELYSKYVHGQVGRMVRTSLESSLSGDETVEAVREKVRALVDDELRGGTRPAGMAGRRAHGRNRWE